MPAPDATFFHLLEKQSPSSLVFQYPWNEFSMSSFMQTPEYKAAKIANVSHLDGGGLWEINFVTIAAPVCPT